MAEAATRKSLHRALIALLLLALGGTLVWWLARPKPLAVLTASVGRGTVEATVANTRAGTVEACQRTKLSTITGGRIEVLAVKEGDTVRKGQLLMQLWSDDQQAAADACARAARDLAQARGRGLHHSPSPPSANSSAKQLFQQGFVSEVREDNAARRRPMRSAACLRHGQRRRGAGAGAHQRRRARQPAHRAARAVRRHRGQDRRRGGRVLDPVAARRAHAAGDRPDRRRRCLYVTAPIDEVDAPQRRAGQPVRITIDALPGSASPAACGASRRTCSTSRSRRAPSTSKSSSTTRDAAGPLLVGYSADVEVVLDARDDVLRVPTQALLEGSRVLVLRTATAGRAALSRPAFATGSSPKCRRDCGRRRGRHLARPCRASRRGALPAQTARRPEATMAADRAATALACA